MGPIIGIFIFLVIITAIFLISAAHEKRIYKNTSNNDQLGTHKDLTFLYFCITLSVLNLIFSIIFFYHNPNKWMLISRTLPSFIGGIIGVFILSIIAWISYFIYYLFINSNDNKLIAVTTNLSISKSDFSSETEKLISQIKNKQLTLNEINNKIDILNKALSNSLISKEKQINEIALLGPLKEKTQMEISLLEYEIDALVKNKEKLVSLYKLKEISVLNEEEFEIKKREIIKDHIAFLTLKNTK